MFTKILDDLTLANRFADEIFRNITGDTYNGDVSFIATMRALLSSRVGAEEIKESYTSSNHDAAALRNVSAETLVNAVIGTRLRENNLYIHNVRRADASSRDAFFGILDNPENGFVKVIKGFEEITNIRDFIANTMRFRTRFYTSQEKRVTIIFVEQMNVKRWHAIQ